MSTAERRASDYDALLVVSFGGPEGPDDVAPFLDNVFRGLRVSPETQAHVAKRYEHFGGVSPINAQTRALIKALQHELDAHGPALPIYWGNRNWHPLLNDTLAQMANAGVRRALAYVTSTFSSYSGCRNIAKTSTRPSQGLPSPPRIDKLRVGFNHPGFIARDGRSRRRRARDVPHAEARARADPVHGAQPARVDGAQLAYEAQLRRAAGSSATRSSTSAGGSCTRATTLRTAASHGSVPTSARRCAKRRPTGASSVVVAPIGFVCDHMEVVLDLDVEAAAIARELGLDMARAATVGTHPAYVAMVRELVVERLTPDAPRRRSARSARATTAARPIAACPGGPGPPKPALCGVDDPFAAPPR